MKNGACPYAGDCYYPPMASCSKTDPHRQDEDDSSECDPYKNGNFHAYPYKYHSSPAGHTFYHPNHPGVPQKPMHLISSSHNPCDFPRGPPARTMRDLR